MARLYYASFKEHIQAIVMRTFPPAISKRFSYRMDSEIYIPKMVKSVYDRKKAGRENLHIMFDDVEVLEIEHDVRMNVQAELLKGFKMSIERGILNIDKKPEYMSTEDVRKRKTEIKRKKKRAVIESIKEARANPMEPHALAKMVADQTKKAKKATKLVKEENKTIITN